MQTVVSRRFDRLNAHGIGFSDFVILYLLNSAQDGKMRRVDLAEKTGLTASGITRLLSPLEKIGLVGREVNERDARVSYVLLTAAGKKIYEEARVTAEHTAKDILPAGKAKAVKLLAEMLSGLGGNIQ
ncbi:transcriptional regulator, MarR family [Filimonas lacunae]|nr:transcriptional regulator, MarR family [Filimonas lacunae]